MMPKFGNGNGNVQKTKDQLYFRIVKFQESKIEKFFHKPYLIQN